jgi:hypothetical protein
VSHEGVAPREGRAEKTTEGFFSTLLGSTHCVFRPRVKKTLENKVMTKTNCLVGRFTLVTILAFGASTAFGQSAIPTRGGNDAGQRQGFQGRGEAQAEEPVEQIVSPLATVSEEVTGPGPMFESLMELKAGDDMAHFNYETEEYYVSGVANGEPYKTRIVIRRPGNDNDFSGLVLAESMHPSGNQWMFHFTHRYTMSSGHVAVDILTSNPTAFAEFNEGRYGDLRISNGQASDIIAQVGAMLKSKQPGNPLAGLPLRKMVLAGTSASAGALIRYLPTHMSMRLSDLGPIFDGFLPTSTGANVRQIDVPLIQVPTMTEVHGGNATVRQDSDEIGDQYRSYEFAGMAHIDSRDAAAYYPDPCQFPISRFPMAAFMSVALDHLFKWVDSGVTPPRADRIWVDRNTANDGSHMALDEYGNAIGGIRNPYVDVPTKKISVRNRGAEPPIPNAHPFVGVRGPEAQNQLCGLAGYEIALSKEQLREMYGDVRNYRSKVEQSYDQRVREGWALPVYKDVIMADAAAVEF